MDGGDAADGEPDNDNRPRLTTFAVDTNSNGRPSRVINYAGQSFIDNSLEEGDGDGNADDDGSHDNVELTESEELARQQSRASVATLGVLKNFEKALPTLEHIESIIAAEEKQKADEQALLLLKAQLEAEAAAEGKEQGDEGTADADTAQAGQFVETAPDDSADDDEYDGDDIDDVDEAQEEELPEEEEDEIEDFDGDDGDDKEKSADDLVFMGFADDDKDKVVVDDNAGVETEQIVLAFNFDDLVNEIVTKSIDKASKKDMEAFLRNRLDRAKMFEYFRNLWRTFHIEQRKRFLLNRKSVDYFRRKKYERALSENNPDTLVESIKKYRNNLLRLNDINIKRASIEEDITNKIINLKLETIELQKQSEVDSDGLSKLLKDTGLICFSKKTGIYLSDKIVEYLIRRTTTIRNQISEIRLSLITSQHRVATLTDRARKLEDLGNGLCQADFEQLRAETQGLADKIEERNNELAKLRLRCNDATHILSNIREKQNMLASSVLHQERIYDDLVQEQVSCRNYLHSIKMERDKLRRKYNRMSFGCGLIDKPSMLHDYDLTSERVNKAEEVVNQLKNEKIRISENMQVILKKLPK